MTPSFDYSQAKREMELIAAQFPAAALRAGVPAMDQAMLSLHGSIPEYPEASADSFAPDGMSFASDKARAYFFWAVKNGKMAGWAWVDPSSGGRSGGHPQKTGSTRSGTLGRRWTEETSQKGEVISGEIGTNVAYAPWVVGPDFPGEDFGGATKYQAKVHAGRWFQFVPVMEANEGEAWDEFEKTFWVELEREMRGGS